MRSAASRLALLYAYLPFVDTSGYVAAGRLMEFGGKFDLVAKDLGERRERDLDAAIAYSESITDAVYLPGTSSYSNWPHISRWIADSQTVLNDREPYSELYSRSMWVAAALSAALYKANHPDTVWTAELSDPLSRDVQGSLRREPLDRNDPVGEQLTTILTSNHLLPNNSLTYSWAEQLIFSLADSVIVTNANQRSYMLDYLRDSPIHDLAERKMVVNEHPIPPERFYWIQPSTYHLTSDKLHIGYFGYFYPNRQLTELFDALTRIPTRVLDAIQVHVFTNDPSSLRPEIQRAQLDDTVAVNLPIPRLEYLNLLHRMDCVVVRDADTKSYNMSINPFLPSKYADCVGSGTPIWSIYEPGSSLSSHPSRWRSPVGSVQEAKSVLEAIVRDL